MILPFKCEAAPVNLNTIGRQLFFCTTRIDNLLASGGGESTGTGFLVMGEVEGCLLGHVLKVECLAVYQPVYAHAPCVAASRVVQVGRPIDDEVDVVTIHLSLDPALAPLEMSDARERAVPAVACLAEGDVEGDGL